jgi:uncharacterized protein (DUF2147 family)
MLRSTLAGVMITVLLTSCPVVAAEPLGTWLTANKQAKIKIVPCGEAYCGTVVWVAGNDKDVHNPDPTKRSHSVLGQQIIFGMTRSGSSYRGRLYNVEDGKTYRGRLDVLDERRIKLSGCVLGGLVCRSQVWTRTP